ncbi:MAG: TlpA disulfide reductase family protein [Acidobacteriota bacterium]
MFLHTLLSLFLALSQAPAAQAPIPVPKPTATTPSACAAEVRAFADAESKTAGITPGAPVTDPALQTQLRRINTAKLAMTRACAAMFDAKTVDASQLTAALQLYGDANVLDQAQIALDRALPVKTMAPADRAALLVTAIPITRRISPTGSDRTWRVANMYPKVEALVDELEANSAATFDQKWSAHTTMESVYRGDDIDAGIIKHGNWILAAAKSFSPADHVKYGRSIASAHVNMAEAYAGQGMNDKALQLLNTALSSCSDVPGVVEMVTPTLARYKLVGTRAANITAPMWFNGPASKSLDLAGKVTLLEFTAHWCGPCRESYPGVNRLRAKYGAQGFQVVLSTRLYGYFESERNLAADAEIAKDKTYFEHHELSDVPVAIGPYVSIKSVNGKIVYEPQPDPNDVAYGVSGIPQIHLIDKKGNLRLIMVGYDNSNEAQLSKIIEAMLKEK